MATKAHALCILFTLSSQQNSSSFTLFSGEWSAQSTTGEAPPPMSDHTFTKISRNRAVVFGGESGGCRFNDAYLLDLETWVWYTQTI